MLHLSRSRFVFVSAVLAFGASVAVRASETGATAEQTAQQKFKDIQSLKDVSVGQFDITMQYFDAALGWQCQNCHVRDRATGVFSYEAEKKEKTVAREMIELVRTVNAGDYGAKINCATCHQGHNEPIGLANAAMMTPDQIAALAAQAARQAGLGPGAAGPGGAAGAGRPGGAPAPPQGGAPAARPTPPPPPPVEPIIEQYIKAMGGQTSLDKLQSRIVTGTVTNRATQTMPFVIEEQGNKFASTLQNPKGDVRFGFDGKAGWLQTPTESADLEGFQLQQAMRLNDLRRAADFAKRYTNLQAGRPTRLPARTPGGQAINVNLVQGDVAPDVQERLFFDTTTGLLMRRQIITRAALNGALVETIDYSDYKDVSGVPTPFTIKLNNWNTLDVYTVTDVKLGATVDASHFTKPVK